MPRSRTPTADQSSCSGVQPAGVTPREKPSSGVLVVKGFRYVDPVAHRIYCYYEAESLQGIAVPLTAYDILCLRLASFVRLPAPPEAQDSIHDRELDLP